MSSRPAGSPDRATVAAFLAVAVFGGLNAIAVRQTVAELDPFWSAGARFIAAGLILAGITLARRRRFPRGRGLAGAVAYGTVGLAAAFGFVYPALRDVPAGTAASLIALTPLATYALAIAQRQERFSIAGLVGGVIAVAGVGIVFADQLAAAVPLGALLLVVAGVLCIAESAVIVKAIPRSDPIATNAVAMLAAGAIHLSISFVVGETPALPATTATWLWFGYLVLLGSVALFSLYVFALERWTASAVSYTTLLMPFVGVGVATVLTGERFSLALVAGGLVLLAGVYVGAFLAPRPKRSTATSAAECLPIEDCGKALVGVSAPAGSAGRA
ncbi:MAG TPA: EamA family transporter [Candidatus Limnocylindria bacterium]|nr:EamA family transporter [Candidatus Limnocylindria bacterium]